MSSPNSHPDPNQPVLTVTVTLTASDNYHFHLPGPMKTPFDKTLLVGHLMRAAMSLANTTLEQAQATGVAIGVPTPETVAELLKNRGKKP